MIHTSLLPVYIILAIVGSFFVSSISYADSGEIVVNATGSTLAGSEKKDIKEDVSSEVPESKVEQNDQKTEEENTKKNLNLSFIELGKTIGAKTIKNLNTRYIKEYPDVSDRKKALEATKAILVLRKNKKAEGIQLSETGKIIIAAFLDNMIDLLDKKIEELGN